MSVALDREEFVTALAVRGLAQQDLALLAGLSESVISQAARGKPISGPTFGRIAAALAAAPPVAPDAARLLGARTAAEASNKTAAEIPTSAAIEELGRAAAHVQTRV